MSHNLHNQYAAQARENDANKQYHVLNESAPGSAKEPKNSSQIPGVLEGPVHTKHSSAVNAVLNDIDPRVKDHPGSATTGGHHTIPKVGETHHKHNWKE